MVEHVRWTLTITWNAFCRPPGYCRRCWFPWDSKTLNPSPKPKQKKTRTQCLAKKTSLVATSGLGRTWRHKIDWKKHEKGNPDWKHALAMHFKTSQRPSPCFAGTAQDFWSILSRLDGLFPRCFMLFPVSPPLLKLRVFARKLIWRCKVWSPRHHMFRTFLDYVSNMFEQLVVPWVYVCNCLHVDTWMDGSVDVWMDGWIDGWMDGWTGRWISTCIDRIR